LERGRREGIKGDRYIERGIGRGWIEEMSYIYREGEAEERGEIDRQKQTD